MLDDDWLGVELQMPTFDDAKATTAVCGAAIGRFWTHLRLLEFAGAISFTRFGHGVLAGSIAMFSQSTAS